MNEQQPFEAIRKSDEAGREYWSARNLGPLLDYKEWRNFYKVIAKAIISCEASGHPSADHFVETNKMVELGSTPAGILKISTSHATPAIW